MIGIDVQGDADVEIDHVGGQAQDVPEARVPRSSVVGRDVRNRSTTAAMSL